MLYRQLYSELGKLLYAITDADHEVSKREREKLKEIVRNELVPCEKSRDSFGTDDAFYAEFEFEVAEEQNLNPDDAFQSFLDFAKEKKLYIDEQHRKIILRVINEIAASYYGKNKKEQEMIEAVRKIFHSKGKSKILKS